MNKKKLFSIMLFVVLLFSACSKTISTSSSFSEAPIPPESFDASIPEVVDTLNINSDIRIDFFHDKNSTDVKLEKTKQISSGYFGQTFMYDGDIYTKIRENSTKKITFEKHDIEKQSSEIFFTYDKDCIIDFIDEETLLVTLDYRYNSLGRFFLYDIETKETSLFTDKYSLLDFKIVQVFISGKTIFIIQEEEILKKYHITMIDDGGNVTIIDHTFEDNFQTRLFIDTSFVFIAKNGNLFIPYKGIYYLLNTNYSFPVPVFRIENNGSTNSATMELDVVDDKLRILYYNSTPVRTEIEWSSYFVGNKEVNLFEINMLGQNFVGQYFAEDTYTFLQQESISREYYICDGGIIERVEEADYETENKVSPSDYDVLSTYFIYYSINDNKQYLFSVAQPQPGLFESSYDGMVYDGIFYHTIFSTTTYSFTEYLNIIQGEILSSPAFASG